MSEQNKQPSKSPDSAAKSAKPKKAKEVKIRGQVDRKEKQPKCIKYVFIPQFSKFMQDEKMPIVSISEDQAETLNSHAHVTGVAYAIEGSDLEKKIKKVKNLREIAPDK